MNPTRGFMGIYSTSGKYGTGNRSQSKACENACEKENEKPNGTTEEMGDQLLCLKLNIFVQTKSI